MNYLQSSFLFCLALSLIKLITSENRPSMMRGNFKSCLQRVCHLITDIFFVDNDCFNNNKELGIYYYLNDLLRVGQLNEKYEIISSNCTISSKDIMEIDNKDLYSFIDDRYKIVYLVALIVEKFIICFLCLLLIKNKKKLALLNKIDEKNDSYPDKPLAPETHFQTIQEHYPMRPTAPPLPNESFALDVIEKNKPETRGRLFSSTISEIYPNLSTSTAMNDTLSKSSSCKCHATALVCTNCSCVRNKRACNVNCHVPNKSRNSKRQQPLEFRCINRFN